MANSPESAGRLFAAPRRFDLATLFVVSLAYAALFSSFRRIQISPWGSLIIAGFISIVGVAQAVLFRGRRPRTASIVAGVTMFWSYVGVATIVDWTRGIPPFNFFVDFLVAASLWGIIGGYFAGVAVGGVFMSAHYLRKWFSNRQ